MTDRHSPGKGVNFVDNRKVTAFDSRDTPLRDEIVVTGLRYKDTVTGETGVIAVDEDDFVFDTNGSITDSAAIGDLDTPITEDHRFGPSAELWKQATEHFYGLTGDRPRPRDYPTPRHARSRPVPPRGVAVEARRPEAAARAAAAQGHDVVRRVRDACAAGQTQHAGLPQHRAAGTAVGRVAVDGVLVGPALPRVDAAPGAARRGAAVEAGRERHAAAFTVRTESLLSGIWRW